MSRPDPAPWDIPGFGSTSAGQVKMFNPGQPQPDMNNATAYNNQEVNQQQDGWNNGWNQSWDQNYEQKNQEEGGNGAWNQDWNNQWEPWNSDGTQQNDALQQPHHAPNMMAQPAGVASDVNVNYNPAQEHLQQQHYQPPQNWATHDQPPVTADQTTGHFHMNQPSVDTNTLYNVPLDNSQSSSQDYPSLQSTEQKPVQNVQLEAPGVLPASNSFSNLPHEPSPFDDLSAGGASPDVVGKSLQLPPKAPASQSHSRQSSFGNVHFIVGDSANTSASQSPHTFGPSGRESNGTPDTSLNQDLPLKNQQQTANVGLSQVPNEVNTQQVPVASGIGRQDSNFSAASSQQSVHSQHVYDRSPSVTSARSVETVDSIGHEITSQVATSSPARSPWGDKITPPGPPITKSPAGGSNPFRRTQASPRHIAKQPLSQSTPPPKSVGASDPINATQSITTPEDATPANPNTSNHEMSIYAQPLETSSPTSPFRPPVKDIPANGSPLHHASPPQTGSAMVSASDADSVGHQGVLPSSPEHQIRRRRTSSSSSQGPNPDDYKHSLSYHYHKQRNNNMSPATTLWQNPEPSQLPVAIQPVAPSSELKSDLQQHIPQLQSHLESKHHEPNPFPQGHSDPGLDLASTANSQHSRYDRGSSHSSQPQDVLLLSGEQQEQELSSVSASFVAPQSPASQQYTQPAPQPVIPQPQGKPPPHTNNPPQYTHQVPPLNPPKEERGARPNQSGHQRKESQDSITGEIASSRNDNQSHYSKPDRIVKPADDMPVRERSNDRISVNSDTYRQEVIADQQLASQGSPYCDKVKPELRQENFTNVTNSQSSSGVHPGNPRDLRNPDGKRSAGESQAGPVGKSKNPSDSLQHHQRQDGRQIYGDRYGDQREQDFRGGIEELRRDQEPQKDPRHTNNYSQSLQRESRDPDVYRSDHNQEYNLDQKKPEPGTDLKNPDIGRDVKDSDVGRYPRDSDLRRDPQDSDPRRDPRDPGIKRDPWESDSMRDPRDSDQRMDPRDSDQRRDPRDSDRRRDPRDSDPRRNPRDSDPMRDQRDSDPTRDQRDSDPRGEPRDFDHRRDPRDSDPRREPRDFDRRRDPRDSDPRRDPRDSDQRRDPRDSDRRRDPRDSEPRKDPRDSDHRSGQSYPDSRMDERDRRRDDYNGDPYADRESGSGYNSRLRKQEAANQRGDYGDDRRMVKSESDDRRGVKSEYGRNDEDDRYRDPRSRRGRRYDDERGGSRTDRDDFRRHDSYDNRYRPSSRNSHHPDDSRYDEYDRPRSRQGHYPEDPYTGPGSRPSSRQGYPDRPRSRAEYDRPRSRAGYDDEDYYSRPRSRSGYDDDYNRPRSRSGYPDDDYKRPRSRSGYPGEERRSGHSYHDDYQRRQREYYGDYPRERGGYNRDFYHQQQQYSQYYGQQGYYGHDYYSQYGYKDQYQKGYMDEMSSYLGGQGQPAQAQQYNMHGYAGSLSHSSSFDQLSQHSGAQSISSRGSTPSELGSETGADHFARESGSRPSSRQSGYEVPGGFGPPPPIMQPHSHMYPPHGYPGYYGDGYYGQGYGYPEQYMQPQEMKPAVPRRTTPLMFSRPHVRACFGAAGQLIKIVPTRPAEGEPALVEIQDVSQALVDNYEGDRLRAFHGPLVRGETHKMDVLLFCQKMAQRCASDTRIRDRESAELIWRYLELLIKQNGTALGTDVAELLLEGHEPGLTSRRSRQHSGTPASEESGEHVTNDRTVVNSRTSLTGLQEVTDRFRHLLLHGRKKDALEWAMKQELWGHALFLATKMDAKTHAMIMTRFANVTLKMNDPLQTLFQLMSHRQPAAVTMVADENWGDWRPHLAMVLSNPTSRHDLDKKSIVTLGDTLAAKRCLYASHFCYLVADVGFGSYTKKGSKIVLIGSNHSYPLEEFTRSTAVQCTEVYEYARSLGNPAWQIVSFQILKFLYMVRLCDHGLTEEAFHYCEVLAMSVIRNPTFYPAALAQGVFTIASNLKMCDPQRLQAGEEAQDPYWLIQLQAVLGGLQDGSILPVSGPQTPFGQASVASSEVADIMLNSASYYPNTQTQPVLDSSITSSLPQASQQQPWPTTEAYPQNVASDPNLLPQPSQGDVWTDQSQQQQQQHYQQQQQQHQQQQQLQQTQQQEVTDDQLTGTSTAGAWSGQQWDQTDYTGSYLNYMPQHQAGTEPDPMNQASEPINIQPDQSQVAPANQDLPREEPGPVDSAPLPESLPAEDVKTEDDELDYYRQSTQPRKQSLNKGDYDDDEDPEFSLSSLSSDLQDLRESLTASTMPRLPCSQFTQVSLSPSLAPIKEADQSKGFSGIQAQPATQSPTCSTPRLGGMLHDSPPNSPLSQGSSTPRAEQPPSFPTFSNNAPSAAFQFGVLPPSNRVPQTSMPLGASALQYNQAPAPPTYSQATPSFGDAPPPPKAASSSTSQDEDRKPEVVKKQKWPGEDDDDMADLKKTKGNKPLNRKDQKGSWLGSIFKFGKGKNEMKLPDDRNPAIVWDEKLKKWVNNDPDAEDTSVPAGPPPKDSELPTGPKPAETPQQQTKPSLPGPPPSSNRFSLQKQRGARGQYVDVLGGSAKKTTATPANLFNVMPKSASVPAKLFVPSASSEDLASQGGEDPQQSIGSASQQAPPSAAEQQAPTETEASQQLPEADNLSHASSQSSLSREVQSFTQLSHASSQSSLSREVQSFTQQAQQQQQQQQQQPPTSTNYAQQAVPQDAQQAAAPPPSMPVMFNPAQFSGSGSGFQQAPPQAGRGPRYGQRRAYPK